MRRGLPPGGQWHRHRYLGPLTRQGAQLEIAADLLGPFLHDAQAEPAGRIATGPTRIESTAVILQRHPRLAVLQADVDGDSVGAGVFAHLGQCFLDDAQQLYLNQGIHCACGEIG